MADDLNSESATQPQDVESKAVEAVTTRLAQELRQILTPTLVESCIRNEIRKLLTRDDIERWIRCGPRGILTCEEIKDKRILVDADDAGLQAGCSYDLRLGAECFLVGESKGESKMLDDARGPCSVVIEPFGSLAFQTEESLKMPNNVIGRFDLKIRYALKGLIVQVGTQVEPNYKGRLFGMLLNTSAEPVELFHKEPFLTIEFSYTNGVVEAIPTPATTLRDFLKSKKIGAKRLREPTVISQILEEVKILRLQWVMVSIAVAIIAVLTTTALNLYQRLSKVEDDLRTKFQNQDADRIQVRGDLVSIRDAVNALRQPVSPQTLNVPTVAATTGNALPTADQKSSLASGATGQEGAKTPAQQSVLVPNHPSTNPATTQAIQPKP